jgi:hypothetical protein
MARDQLGSFCKIARCLSQNREKYREFLKIERIAAYGLANLSQLNGHLGGEFPTKENREFFCGDQGRSLQGSGNFGLDRNHQMKSKIRSFRAVGLFSLKVKYFNPS